ncbi:MAG: exonuclease domain-containing protein [Lachnospiraceae bacterium]|nr:exonuclease domain-containing protein [Lachnospiraceae bacterium]
MNYIVLDLEWNQCPEEEEARRKLGFEIIEIGAVKLDADRKMISEFGELIRPQIYHEINKITSSLVHVQMKELDRGRPFPEAADAFLRWCGKDYIFCTWGSQDLTELQHNMRFYGMKPLAGGPICFLDVQKLFSLAYEDGKSRRTLEHAVSFLEIPKDIPFHRAFSDAYYTGKILMSIENTEILRRYSYDVFHPPGCREDEISVVFDTYAKYISRVFANKQEAFQDREVISSKCYLCHRNLKKKIRWFGAGGRHYYCLAYCEKHGYLKGKIRVKRTEDGQVYIVKTTKIISPAEAEKIAERREHAKELRRHKS